MMTQLTDFIEEGLQHVWGDRAQPHMPGMSMTVRDGDVGFYVFYCDDFIKWSSIVHASTPVTLEVLKIVQEINSSLPIGAVTVQTGDEGGDAIILWSYKVLPRWVEPGTQASIQLMLDVTTHVPTMVRLCREKLAGFGQPHVPDDLGVLMFFS